MITPPTFSPAGVYAVRVYDPASQEPRYVVVDDYIPCDSEGQPVFAHCASFEQIWVMLLEKAYAKVSTR